MSGILDLVTGLIHGAANFLGVAPQPPSQGASPNKRRRITTSPIPHLKVKTLNVSWEANNAQKVRGGFVPQKYAHPSRSWSRVRAAWDLANSNPVAPRDRATGPAYQKSLRELFRDDPHVVLLQEFQHYWNPNTNSNSLDDITRWRTQRNKRYEIVARDDTTNRPPASCVVAVRSDCIDQTDGGPKDISSWYDWTNTPFQDTGRPIAVAEVTLKTRNGRGKYLIVSSHSAHGHSNVWNSPQNVQLILDRLAAQTDAPFLIWGGDFNAQVRGRGLQWKGIHVRKMSGDQSPGTLHGRAVDWILATPSNGRNPLSHVVTQVASDHNMVYETISAQFSDLAR